MVKKKSMFYATSILLASVFGSAMFKNKQQTAINEEKMADVIRVFVGQYWFFDRAKQIQHSLKIDEQLRIWIDDKVMDGKWMELSRDAVTFQDHFGYHLIIEAEKDEPTSLYDEADNQSFSLSRKNVLPV